MYKKDDIVWIEHKRNRFIIEWVDELGYNVFDMLMENHYHIAFHEVYNDKTDILYTDVLKFYKSKVDFTEWIAEIIAKYDTGLVRWASSQIKRYLEQVHNIS